MILVNPRTQQIGVSLPETTTIEWDSVDKPFRHVLLMVDKGSGALGKKALLFGKVEVTETPGPTATTVEKAGDIAGTLIRKQISDYGASVASHSFDIDLDRRTWLLIELDPTVNWRFSPEYPAVTTKTEYKPYMKNGKLMDGFNVQLRYVYLDKSKDVIVTTEIPPNDVICRFVFFGVVHRRDNERHQFNFAVEFYQSLVAGIPADTIPLIVDPTVPEDGHDEFPPP